MEDFKPDKVEMEDFKPDDVEVEDHKPVLVMEKFEGQDKMTVVSDGEEKDPINVDFYDLESGVLAVTDDKEGAEKILADVHAETLDGDDDEDNEDGDED